MEVFISASIVLYNTGKQVRNSIESFLSTSLPVRLYLIDNSPTGHTKQFLKNLLSDKRIEYIHNKDNIGFGAAHNIALRKVIKLSAYHLVLNPDVYFEGDVLNKLFSFMQENQDVGLVLPKVVYPNGELQHLSKLLPTPFDLIFRRFLPSSLIKKRLFYYEMQFSEYNRKVEVPYISGCFMFMRTSLLPVVGLFDERFFLYLEDTDLSRRFSIAGKNIFYPDAQIIHYHERGSYKDFRLLIKHIKSAIKYFNKWGWWIDKERKELNNKAVKAIQNSTSPHNSSKTDRVKHTLV